MDQQMDTYLKFDSQLWEYLSQGQKDLITEGRYLLKAVKEDEKYQFKDYSFLVFPFAKAYEGFLKQICLDVKFITRLDYISDHFRLGKVLSPHLVKHLGNHSVYKRIKDLSGQDLADKIWNVWKMGRNQVFHYFPHNLHSLTQEEAEVIISHIIQTMNQAVVQLKIDDVKQRLQAWS